MQITNNYNLPSAVYNVIAKEYYDDHGSDYSVTQLKDAPRIVQLKRRYKDSLTEDAIDRVWSLFGNVAHNLLEQHASDNAITEERLSLKIKDRVLSGKVDHYEDGIITDYKVTSAWSLVYGSRADEWAEQLNPYAFLFTSKGYKVRGLQIVAILRDWDRNKAKNDANYPQTPIVVIPIPLWTKAQQKKFITNSVSELIANETREDHDLTPCTPSQMWEKASVYAVMKKGRKTAVRLYDNQDAADAHREELGKDAYVQVRPGARTRCEQYCSVAGFCNIYQDYINQQAQEAA